MLFAKKVDMVKARDVCAAKMAECRAAGDEAGVAKWEEGKRAAEQVIANMKRRGGPKKPKVDPADRDVLNERTRNADDLRIKRAKRMRD